MASLQSQLCNMKVLFWSIRQTFSALEILPVVSSPIFSQFQKVTRWGSPLLTDDCDAFCTGAKTKGETQTHTKLRTDWFNITCASSVRALELKKLRSGQESLGYNKETGEHKQVGSQITTLAVTLSIKSLPCSLGHWICSVCRDGLATLSWNLVCHCQGRNEISPTSL